MSYWRCKCGAQNDARRERCELCEAPAVRDAQDAPKPRGCDLCGQTVGTMVTDEGRRCQACWRGCLHVAVGQRTPCGPCFAEVKRLAAETVESLRLYAERTGAKIDGPSVVSL